VPGQRAPSFRRRRLLGAAAIAPAAGAHHASQPRIKDNRLQADFVVRSVDMDASRVPALLEEASAWHADLIYTWGTPVSLTVAAGEIDMREMRVKAGRVGAQFTPHPVPLDDQGQPRASAIPAMLQEFAAQKAQLIYIGPDSIASQRILVTETALALGLPVFSAAEVALRDGSALFGLVAGYRNVGRLTAHKAAQILYHRVKPGALPVETPGTYSYLVNMDVARQLGMMPPARVLQFAEQIK